jgi:hypothetical protein
VVSEVGVESNKEILRRRKNYLIASLLSFKDERCDGYLPDDVSDELRFLILSGVNEFCFFAESFIDDSVIQNEAFLERFDTMFRMVEGISDGG